jgi:hypothetical protein
MTEAFCMSLIFYLQTALLLQKFSSKLSWFVFVLKLVLEIHSECWSFVYTIFAAVLLNNWKKISHSRTFSPIYNLHIHIYIYIYLRTIYYTINCFPHVAHLGESCWVSPWWSWCDSSLQFSVPCHARKKSESSQLNWTNWKDTPTSEVCLQGSLLSSLRNQSG